MNNIIDKLVQGLNGTGGLIPGLSVTSTLNGATASRNSSGNLVLTANTAGVPFTPPTYSSTNIISVNDQVITSNQIQPNVQEVIAKPEVLEEKVFTLENTSVVEAGDSYTLNIDGHSISYTVKTTDTTKSDIVNGLYNLLHNTASLSYINFTNEGTDIRMTAARNFSVIPSSIATSYITEPTTITKTILQQNETGQSADIGLNIAGIPSLQEISKFTLSGDILIGSTLFMQFSGATNSSLNVCTYISKNGDTLDSIKSGLLNVFNNSSLATKKVYISDGSDTLIQVNQFDMSIDASGDIILKSYSDNTKTGLYNSQNGGYVYSNSTDLDNQMNVWKTGTTNFTPTITSVNTYSAEVFPVTPQAQQEKYSFSGTVEPRDTYTIGNITYTVQPTDTTIGNIVDKLIIGLNGGTAVGLSGTSSLSGVTASKDASGMLLLTANVAGTPFTAPSFQTTNVVTSNDQNISLINTINNVLPQNENRYSISGFINQGNTYNIGGAIYTAQAGDTIEDVIDGLVNSVNGNNVSGVSGTPISGVVAAKTPPPIQILIKPSVNFTISANVDLSNLTASELKNDLSINSNNVVTFNSSNSKYSTYTEDSTIDYNNETQSIDTQNIQSVNSLSGLKNLNYLTIEIAQRYMTIVDDSLTALNNFRGSFGSAQNQLESASRNLMTQYTNLKNAESVIRDVDYAEESMNFNRLNIVGQGAVYAQSKANERKQDIIRLLQS
jgi:flagellin